MKKTLILFAAFLLSYQLVNAQTNPALLTNFKIGSNSNTGYKMSWSIANNEVVDKFDVQKSTNGTDFTTIAVLFASQKTGAENYQYNEENTDGTRTLYRLKMTSRGHDVYYSNILVVSNKKINDNKISILGNPVKDKLVIRFNELQNQPLHISIYDLAGRSISRTSINKSERSDNVNIPLNTSMSPGIYIAEVNNGMEIFICKFVKQ